MAFVDAKINDKWDIRLPDFRAQFHADRPKWEAGRLAHMAETVKPGWTIFDIGAESGDFTSLYKLWVGDEGAVVPVEPQADYWGCIRQTWDANVGPKGPPVTFLGFVSDKGEARTGVYQGQWPECGGPLSPVIEEPGFRHLISGSTVIPSIRIDTLAFKSNVYPDAIVMDIEGAEYHALLGLDGLVEEGHWPHAWVSVHRPTMAQWYGSSLRMIENLMRDLGYHYGIQLEANGEGEEFWYWEPPRELVIS